METQVKKQFCPICETEVQYSQRYPLYVCADCFKKAVSADNRPLSFSNLSLSGGFAAYYADTKEIYDSHVCFIDNIECRADEARFGGIVIQTKHPKKKDQIIGALIGLLVGDALGVPFEFYSSEELPFIDGIEFEPPAYFHRSHAGVPPGTWSDDGAQALCLLASLLECGKFDADDFAQKLVAWFREDYMAVDQMFDVGIQTQRAVLNLRKGIPPLEAGLAEEKNNGNGSLMRVLPLALWHRGTNEELVADAFAQSAVTHGHLRSKLCCALYCLWARQTLNHEENAWDKAVAALNVIFPKGTPEYAELHDKILPEPEKVRGSGYVVDSLQAARWLNVKESSFEDVVKSAVLLGDDTDTTACIAGGIAGLKFGVNAIPTRWRENLRGAILYQPLLEKLLERF